MTFCKKHKRGVFAFTAVCLAVLSAFFAYNSFFAAAEETPLPESAPSTVAIASSDDLIAYSREYARGGHNPDDTIQLALSSGSFFLLPSGDDGYIPLGSASRPFNGKIEIADNATGRFISDAPLFGTVTTDARIVNTSGAVREVTLARLEGDSVPLFAASVVCGASNTGAHWNVRMEADARDSVNQTAFPFAGVIGTVADNCKLRVDFTHAAVSSAGAPGAAEGTDDLGVICGTLGENAELTFSISSANEFSVTSTGGHAGGVVGSMGTGSKLIVASSFVSHTNVTASGSGKYAGGLAGYAVDASIVFENASTAEVSKTVSGSAGAGAVYGYYKSTVGNGDGISVPASTRAFDLAPVVTGNAFTLAGGSDVGILAGRLEAENSVLVTDSSANLSNATYEKQVRFTGGSNRGGIVGYYANTSLANVLSLSNVKVRVVSNSGSVNASGGLIGSFPGDAPVYASIRDARVLASANVGGGAVGTIGMAGSFLDLDGTIDIDGTVGAGLVDRANAGVIRIRGVSDLSGATYSSAQLVRLRNNALLYALGSGSDADWTFKRGSGVVDDVGDWGEILRLSSASGLTESDFFTVDAAAHTVTVAGHVPAMSNKKDFIKTALNAQLNDEDRGALKFSSSSRSSAILSSSLSLTADLDLSGTGIVSLMRDNGEFGTFTGSFNGNSHTLSLAIGEPYGMNGSTALSAPANFGANNSGTVIAHSHLGLFSKISGATVTNLVTDGFISVDTVRNMEYNVGAIAGSVSGSSSPLTLSGVDTKTLVRIYSGQGSVNCGGAVGHVVSGTSGTVAVSDCTFENSILDRYTGTQARNLNAGGAIGNVSSTSALSFDFDRVKIGGSFDNVGTGSTNFAGIRYGGLIGYVIHNSGSFTRSVSLNGIDVLRGASITSRVKGSARSSVCGAFLGGEWFDTDVVIGTSGASDGIVIGASGTGSAPALNLSGDSTVPVSAALVGKASGHWTVNHVQVASAAINGASQVNFGFLVGDGVLHNNDSALSALYLDLVSDGYDIASASVTGSFGVFDEVVGYSAPSGKTIEENGAAVVSIRTANGDPVVMTGSACNTYQNQTSYATKTNANTRYYYNLDLIREKASPSDAEKLLLWSLNRYAHSSLKNNGYFTNNYGNLISGNCDMAGLSYYPVDAGGVRISNASVKFYNDEIERGESGTGDDDSSARSTRASSPRTQHYMMHEGLFRHYTGSLTVSGLHLAGNVSNRHGGNASGFLICGTLGDTNDTSRVTISGLTLDGAEVIRSSVYGPLLINKIGKNVKLDLSGVSATVASSGDAYPSTVTPVASSLIGDVGSETAININLSFSDIRLDARTAEGGMAGLTSAYKTDRSLFDRATLLNSFRFLNGSLGEYNYTYSEDWNASGHHVTYGSEVTSSAEYAGREDHYYDDAVHYTHPTDSTGAAAYDFSSGFLPYVYNDGETFGTGYYHEIKVNVKDVNLTSGCGQYNDPYLISDGAMLATATKIISGSPDTNVEISLPTDVGSEDMWCTDRNAHDIYVYNGTDFVRKSDSGDPKTLAAVRTYLAGAYYSVSAAQIELPTTFVGFGSLTDWNSTTDFECPYAFRGVIIGNRNIILNHSSNPLVKTANGCVVKDVTVKTDASIVISQANVVPFRYDSLGCASYGAVIGQVMGGDNILDHVETDFTSASFSADSTACVRLEPVGGYVGVVLNGGVVFRNMSASISSGLTPAVFSCVSDEGWLYVNPIVGRVIAGFVFNEASSYARSSATLVNSSKNYEIPDLDPSAAKLSVNATAANAHQITVPNGQALYVLSCVVNSGAGSAAYNGSTEQAYDALTGTPWSGYRAYTMTRCAEYDEVGPSATTSGDYAVVSTADKYLGSVKIPYLIRNYTESSTAMFRARSVCKNSVVSLFTFAPGTHVVPAGYRGIGSIYTNSTACRIQFSHLVGTGATVDLAMRYQEYNHVSGNQNSTSTTAKVENYLPYQDAGFGLFNNLCQSSPSAANCIEGLTLTGSVFYDIRKVANGPSGTSPAGSVINYSYGWHDYQSQTHYYPDPADRLEAKNILHTGGLGGINTNGVYVKNVTLDDLTVEGAKYTGGMIGYSTGKTATFDSPATDGITVIGGFAAGGIQGGFYGNGVFTLRGTDSEDAVIDFAEIRVKGEPSCAKTGSNDFDQMFHCGGGVCGYITTGATSRTATVSHVTVQGGSITAPRRDRRPSDMRYKIMLGGMFGRIENCGIAFSDSTVKEVAFSGNTCGGIAGTARYNVSGSITNVTVDGGSGKTTMDATNVAGGLIGYYYAANTFDVTVSGFTVENYNLYSTVNAERSSAGGLFGTLETTGSTTLNFHDSVIRGVNVSRCQSTMVSDAAYTGVGGAFGAITTANGKIMGHNILVDNVSVVNNGGNRAPGSFIGTNSGNSVKFVGVSIQGGSSASMPTVGLDNTNSGIYGASGYVVLSDCGGTALEAGHNETASSLSTSSDLAPVYPFVTNNPSANIGTPGLFLTGDGVSSSVGGLPIKVITAGSGDMRYRYAQSYLTAAAAADYSLYNSEQNTSHADDFAVLIVDDVSRLNTTNLVNAVLNLLANTRFDYTSNLSKVYSVTISKMIYDSGAGKFVKSNEAANLKRTGGQFYMNLDSVDSAGDMFTLIDVAFFDPAQTSKTAYHLYVPVLVKKMMTYDFVIATGTGTNYERDWYSDRFGSPLMENLGTPASIFFKFSYLRSVLEWNEAVNNGDDLLRNFDKRLTMSKSSSIPDLPANTILVLVDTNRGGKPYYARFSSVYSGGTLNLQNFRETLDDPSSAAFSPVDLNDLLTVTAVSGDGTMVECSEADATVRATLNGADAYFRVATEDDNALTHYTLNVSGTDNAAGHLDTEEPYYISFFTDSTESNTVYHYTISAPSSFNDPANPSRVEDTDKLQNREGTVHLILGNIFVQQGTSITTSPSNTEMSILTNNHVLTATMDSTVTLAASLKSEVQGYLGANSGINVFHSFLLRLTRTDDLGSHKILAGSPSVDGTYRISSVNGSVAATDPDDRIILLNSGYAEIESSDPNRNLNEYLVNGNGAVIHAVMSLDYTTDDSIVAQFPNREDLTNVTVGTTASVSSNIAYDREGTSYSKIAKNADDSAGHSYYCKIDDRKARLYYNVKSDVFVGDYGPLGINPLDNEIVSAIDFSTLAIYDISEIEHQAVGYDQIVLRIRLYQKTDSYSTPLSIPTYLTNVSVRGYASGTAGYSEDRSDSTEYLFVLPRSAVESASALSTALEIPLDYTVLTGALFEAAGLNYSNYKITISAELVNSANPAEPLVSSQASSYLIYTNARVIPDFIN